MAEQEVPFVTTNGCNKIIYLRRGVNVRWYTSLQDVDVLDRVIMDFYVISPTGTIESPISGIYQWTGTEFKEVLGDGPFLEDVNVRITESNAFAQEGEDQKTFNGKVSEAVTENTEDINTLNGQVSTLQGVLASDDFSLDDLQEIVDFIKENRADIEAMQQIPIGVTSDDKVQLTAAYPAYGPMTHQNQFNQSTYSKLITLETNFSTYPAFDTRRTTIAGSATVTHDWGTRNVMVQVFDTATGSEIECEKTREMNGVYIGFQMPLSTTATVLLIKLP